MKRKLLLKLIILIPIVLISLFGIIIYYVGLDQKYISKCKHIKNPTEFCAISTIDLTLPKPMINHILEYSDKKDIGSRVNMPQMKASRTLLTKDIQKYIPELVTWYTEQTGRISEIVGEKVQITPLDEQTSMLVIFYENEGDFINWHYDVNYYNGRFFTLLVPVTFTPSCSNFAYVDKNEKTIELANQSGKSILIEGNIVFHKATKTCANEIRCVVALQYATSLDMSMFSKLRYKLKNMGWVSY